jgi:hypothetical protein
MILLIKKVVVPIAEKLLVGVYINGCNCWLTAHLHPVRWTID